MIGLPDGRRLEAQWWGPGPEAAPSLVLLHQGLGSVSFWGDPGPAGGGHRLRRAGLLSPRLRPVGPAAAALAAGLFA
ncbi:hypothetical protein ACFQU2_24325 [Siccirubricoccus deserti]